MVHSEQLKYWRYVSPDLHLGKNYRGTLSVCYSTFATSAKAVSYTSLYFAVESFLIFSVRLSREALFQSRALYCSKLLHLSTVGFTDTSLVSAQ